MSNLPTEHIELTEQQFTDLVHDCRVIYSNERKQELEHAHALGERINEDFPQRKDNYASESIHRLAIEVGLDERFLYQCKKLALMFKKDDIFRLTRKSFLNFTKVMLVLSLPATKQQEFMARIECGELRTDWQVKFEIQKMKKELGIFRETAASNWERPNWSHGVEASRFRGFLKQAPDQAHAFSFGVSLLMEISQAVSEVGDVDTMANECRRLRDFADKRLKELVLSENE